MQEQNDRIKNQNKKIFEKITSHQEHLQLKAGHSQMSAATAIRQNSDATPSVQDNIGLPQASLMESFGASAGELGQGNKPLAQESSIGEIHSLYQDLFLTDIKQEVEKAQSELKSCK